MSATPSCGHYLHLILTLLAGSMRSWPNAYDVTKAATFTDIDCIPNLPWVVISEYGRKFDWIDFRWAQGSLQSRTILDYRSGKKIATWSPNTEKIITPNSPYNAQNEPYRFDISADGRYLVEGGAGVLTLYKIQS